MIAELFIPSVMGNAELAVESLENTTRLLKWILGRVTSLRYIHLILSYSYWSLDVWDMKFGPFENQNFLSRAFTRAASVLFFIFRPKMEERSERIIQRLFWFGYFYTPRPALPLPVCLSHAVLPTLPHLPSSHPKSSHLDYPCCGGEKWRVFTALSVSLPPP